MVNFGLNSASILGLVLAAAGASLYFLRSVRPELSRDHDIFFAAVGLLCGFILLFQGSALLSIFGVADMLGVLTTSFAESSWRSPTQQLTGFLIILLIYFIISLGLSRYSTAVMRMRRENAVV